jgi:hypothetical protein
MTLESGTHLAAQSLRSLPLFTFLLFKRISAASFMFSKKKGYSHSLITWGTNCEERSESQNEGVTL